MDFLYACCSRVARLIPLLLVLAPTFAFAACGEPPPVAQRQAAVYVIGVSSSGLSLIALGASAGGLLWQTPIPQDSESGVVSVVVTPSQVYVLSGGRPSSADWSVMAVRASDGKVAWSFAAGSDVSGIQVLGDTVYLGSLYGDGVRALRASDGHLLWQHNGNVAALALAGDTLYAALVSAGANMVVALRAGDGAERWHDQFGASPWQVLVDHTTLYVTAGSEVAALQTSDGAQRWRSPVSNGASESLVGAAAGNVYLSQFMQPAALTTLRASDGLLLWQHGLLSKWVNASIITNTAVYVKQGVEDICALRPADGGTAWCYQAHLAVLLAATDEIAYAADATSTLCALQADDGSRRWCQHQAASSLVVSADRLVLATPGGAVCTLHAASGKPVWCHQVAESVFDLTLGS